MIYHLRAVQVVLSVEYRSTERKVEIFQTFKSLVETKVRSCVNDLSPEAHRDRIHVAKEHDQSYVIGISDVVLLV